MNILYDILNKIWASQVVSGRAHLPMQETRVKNPPLPS